MSRPLDGFQVVEVALDITAVGAGIAAGLPGAMLRDLGADVIRVQSSDRPSLDAGVEYFRPLDRGKRVIEVATGAAARDTVQNLASDADVVFLAGPEASIEGQGIGTRQLMAANPRLVGVRVRPSFTSLGTQPDLELLLAVRAGLATQLDPPTPGRPVFPELAVGQVGAGLSAAVGALAGLYNRENTGAGIWAETSLYDGFQAMLPMVIGTVEHHSPSTNLLWAQQGPTETICYACADGEYVQLWFGAKGAYEGFLDYIGDPPTEEGYNADMRSGALVERGKRWSKMFATKDRQYWLDFLAGHKFRCEPTLRPGEILGDPHLRQIGLAIDHDDPDRGPITVWGPLAQVTPAGDGHFEPRPAAGPLLSGVRVVDLSAYLAGPVAPLVLAELGADVVKVEPVTGDVHRVMQPMYAAGQRGKRAVAVNLKSPDAAQVLEKLFQWGDVVHHNSRVGLAEKLGYDEATVRRCNPNVVYSFSSGFGEEGPKALLPTNDQLTQALAGIEAAQAGFGSAPTFIKWGAVDVTGGWVAACGIIAGLIARRRTGRGQKMSSNLLGAGLALKAGAFLADGKAIGGPVLDGDQLGFGAAYRIYEGSDGKWFALVVPDAAAWGRLRAAVGEGGLPEAPPPLRTEGGDLQPEEVRLAEVFQTKPAAAWVAVLHAANVPVEPVWKASREEFGEAFVSDPVNRQLHRVVSYEWGDLGQVNQPRFPPRFGPEVVAGAPAFMADLGEHTAEVLEAVGIDAETRAVLAKSGTILAD